MKKIAYLLLAASLASPLYAAEKNNATNVDAQFDQMFNAVDSNHDGKISKPEAELKAHAMFDVFEKIDSDHDGQLSKQEIKTFTAAMLKSRDDFMRQLEAADKDKNGKLSKEESKAIAKLHDNFDAIDTNHDGQLVFKEISDYLHAQLEAQRTSAK